jgi:hypothetical protein|tara:strand:+ start:2966 stop:3379 length:414 start_codon:yes stop_codon:yes gene_type:complete
MHISDLQLTRKINKVDSDIARATPPKKTPPSHKGAVWVSPKSLAASAKIRGILIKYTVALNVTIIAVKRAPMLFISTYFFSKKNDKIHQPLGSTAKSSTLFVWITFLLLAREMSSSVEVNTTISSGAEKFYALNQGI